MGVGVWGGGEPRRLATLHVTRECVHACEWGGGGYGSRHVVEIGLMKTLGAIAVELVYKHLGERGEGDILCTFVPLWIT